MTSQWLNSLGLLFGMAGVFVLFIWGPPQPDFDEHVGIALEPGSGLKDGTKVSDIKEAAKLRKLQYRARSQVGLALVFFGFAVQLAAVWTTP